MKLKSKKLFEVFKNRGISNLNEISLFSFDCGQSQDVKHKKKKGKKEKGKGTEKADRSSLAI